MLAVHLSVTVGYVLGAFRGRGIARLIEAAWKGEGWAIGILSVLGILCVVGIVSKIRSGE